MAGIEPAASAWKAEVLPIYDTRSILRSTQTVQGNPHSDIKMVEGGGFEPPKAVPADLQSAPFGRSGTPPAKSGHFLPNSHSCQLIY